MRLRKVFTSRWSALLWAGGIVWTAIDVADGAPHAPPPAAASATAPSDADGDAVSADDVRTLAALLNG